MINSFWNGNPIQDWWRHFSSPQNGLPCLNAEQIERGFWMETKIFLPALIASDLRNYLHRMLLKDPDESTLFTGFQTFACYNIFNVLHYYSNRYNKKQETNE